MPSLLQRLGFSEQDRVAIIHIDDLGMCHAANVGAFEALRNGPATCGSVMTTCPWFPEAAELARQNPEFDIGVHLTVNSEWPGYKWAPVAGAKSVPSLVDDQGYLRPTTLEVIAMAEPAEVEIELRAQVDRALGAGIDVTHLDSHMGTLFYNQEFLEAYGRVGLDYRIPVFMPRPSREDLEPMGMADAEPIFRAFAKKMDAAGMPVVDRFDIESLGFEPGQGFEHNRKRLEGLQPGVTYLVCHASRGGAELDAITPDAHAREFERTFYGGAEARELIERLEIRTLGMRSLRQLMRGES